MRRNDEGRESKKIGGRRRENENEENVGTRRIEEEVVDRNTPDSEQVETRRRKEIDKKVGKV